MNHRVLRAFVNVPASMRHSRLLRQAARGCAALLLVSVAAHGQTAEESDRPVPSANDREMEELSSLSRLSFPELLNLPVRTATNVSQNVDEAPAVISVTPRSFIVDFDWRSLQDLMLRQPGFYWNQDFERRTLSSRGVFEGWTGNHTLVLIDGVPFNDPLTGTAPLSDRMPLAFTESVEVLRGPGSVTYGGHAANAVVTLNTIAPPTNGESFLRGRASVGSFGRSRYDVTAGLSTKLASAVLSLDVQGDDGDDFRSPDASGRTAEDGSLLQFKLREGRASAYFFTKLQGEGPLKGFALQYHHQRWMNETGIGYALLNSPEDGESMRYAGETLVASYRSPDSSRLRQEYVLRLQSFRWDWDVRVYPNGFGAYPGGVSESLILPVTELLGRAQLAYRTPSGAQAIAGVENSTLVYRGDKQHTIDADLAQSGEPALPGPVPAGPSQEPILGKPVQRLAAYLQLLSGRFAQRRFLATAGLRYDHRFLSYRDLSQEGEPNLRKSYRELSPRVSLSFFGTEKWVTKLIAGRAFRDPTPDEMFTSNSLLGRGVTTLEAEHITTYELATSWQPMGGLKLGANGYVLDLRDQIGLDSNSVSRNMYSRRTAGGEADVVLSWSAPDAWRYSGYASYSYTHLLREHVRDALLTAERTLTWTPAHTAKAGVATRWRSMGANAQWVYQGRVKRRASDLVSELSRAYRPDEVPGWHRLDVGALYAVTSWAMFRVTANNLLGSAGRIVKTQDFPFDTRIQGRRLLASLELSF